jgi:hypothetical protein
MIKSISLLAAAASAGIVLTVSAPAQAASVNPHLHMSAHLRHHLGAVFQSWLAARSGHRYHHRVDSPHGVFYGRVGHDRFAVVCVYWNDAPQRNTDCGTTFAQLGTRGAWRVVNPDGSYTCTPHVPSVLLRDWKIAQYC